METSPSSDNNRGGGDFFMSVDSLLAASRKSVSESPKAVAWLGEARMAARELTAEELLRGSQTLLEDHPSATLLGLLKLPSLERRRELSTIRRHRRLLLVARDGIIFSTEKHRSSEYDSLRQLCFSLGRFADSDGESELFAAAARTSLRGLIDAEPQANDFQHDDQRMRVKYLQALDGMGVQEAFKPGDIPQSFHQRRKTFRRAVNALVLHAAGTQAESDVKLAENGLRINTAMGHISDRMNA